MKATCFLIILLFVFVNFNTAQTILIDSNNIEVSKGRLFQKSRFEFFNNYNTIKSSDKNYVGLMYSGKAKLRNNAFEDAIQDFHKAALLIINSKKYFTLDSLPSLADPLFFMALCKEAISQTDSAIILLDSVIAIKPDFSQAYIEKAEIMDMAGESAKTIDLLKKSVALDKMNFQSYYMLSIIYKRKNDLFQSMKYINLAVEIEKNTHYLWVFKGELHLANHELKLAENCFKKALQIDSTSLLALNDLGILYYINEHKELAYNAFKKYMSLDSSNYDVCIVLAHCERENNNNPESVRLFAKAYDVIKKNTEKIRFPFENIEFFDLMEKLDNKSLTDDEMQAGYGFYKCFLINDIKNALPLIRIYLNSNPTSLLCRRFYLLSLFQSGDYEFFIEETERLTSRGDSIPNIFMLEAIVFFQQQKYTEAIQCIGKAIKFIPKEEQCYVLMSDCYSKSGQWTSALTSLDKAITLDKKFTVAYLKKAEILKSKLKYAEALTNYRFAMRYSPRLMTSYIDAADLYIRLGNGDSAVNCCTRAIDVDSFLVEPYLKLADSWISLANYKSAMEVLDTAMKYFPGDEELLAKRAQLNLSLKNYAVALINYNELIKSFPKKAYYFTQKGEINLFLKNYDSAIKNYKEALSLNKNYVFAHRRLGQIYKMLKDKDNANRHFEKALIESPQKKEDFLSLAFTYNEMGNFAEAIKLAENALKIDSLYAEALCAIGWSNYMMNKFDQSIHYFNRALALNPYLISAMYAVALTTLREGNVEESKALYIKSKKINLLFSACVNNEPKEKLEELITMNVMEKDCKYILEEILEK